jgi:glycosyltransferase involved in cell wall biosynthesis
VIPAYNEEQGLPLTLTDFLTRPEIDEIIVVDNNSSDNTAQVARDIGVKVISESRQGYGWALRKGLQTASGDLIMLTEADATFQARDVPRLLSHMGDFDFVIGTRTATDWVEPSANMGLFLVAGNIFIAKMLGLLYYCPSLTDVGCTFRVMTRDLVHTILPKLTGKGASLSPEMMVLALKSGARMKEIPVHYGARIGEAKITVSKSKAFKNGLDMLWVVFSRLLRS